MLEHLHDRLGSWVNAGLMTADQAQAIRAFEASQDADEAAATSDGGGRTAIAEVVGYLGAALAVIAVGILLEQLWPQLAPWARALLAGTVTLALLIAGAMVRRLADGPAASRLVSVLWAGAVAGAAFTTYTIADDLARAAEGDVALLTAIAVTAMAGVLHRLAPTSVQQIALGGGVVATAVLTLSRPHAEIDLFFYGLLLWGVGVAWALLAAGGWLRPVRTGVVLGVLAVGFAAEIATTGRYTGPGLVLGLASVAAVLAVAAVARDTVLLGLGVAGVVVFVPQAIFHAFGEALGAPLALLVTGLALVIAAVGLLTLHKQVIEEEETHDGP